MTLPYGKSPVYSQPTSRVEHTPEYSDASTSYSSSRGSAGSYSVGSRSVKSGSSYAGSHSGRDYDSGYSRSGVDVMEELTDRMGGMLNPIPLDRSLAKQAQT